MKKFISTIRLVVLTILMGTSMQAFADEPILTFKTNRFATHGMNNLVQFSMMCKASLQQSEIEVDFGYGKQPYTVTGDGTIIENDSTETFEGGTLIEGSVSAAGTVRIYGNARDFDYLDIHGSEVTEIDLSKLTELSILSLEHNELKKLNVSNHHHLEYLRINDNPFDEGLTLGPNLVYLKYLNIGQIGMNALPTGTIDISCYPALRTFVAWDAKCLRSLDLSQIEYKALMQVSIDGSNVSSLDVSRLPALMILNISDTPINQIDLSHNPYLVELYCANEGRSNPDHKLRELDLSSNIYLQRLFCDGNLLTTLDISKQFNLVSVYASNNNLTSIKGADINDEVRPDSLAYLEIAGNRFHFANLPEVDPLTYFYYEGQQPLPMEAEYCVEAPIDMSSTLGRISTTTSVYKISAYDRDGYTVIKNLEEDVDFTFDYSYITGKAILTFLTEQKNPIRCFFINDIFDGETLETTEFIVRNKTEFGTLVEKFNVLPESGNFTMTLRTNKDATIEVDFGDGNKKPFTATEGTDCIISGTATGMIRVYGKVGTEITYLSIHEQPLQSIDITQATSISSLSITDCQLQSIDLSWNRALRSINLEGNTLTELNLTGDNAAYNKNLLTEINASNNKLSSFTPGLAAITFVGLDLSGNELTDIDLRDMQSLEIANFSDNRFTEFSFDDCTALKLLNANGNDLTAVDLTPLTALEYADLRNNRLTYSTLPTASTGIQLAPQKPISIASIATGVDLSSEDVVNGTATTYVWKNADTDATLTEGTDYTITGGKTKFLSTVTDQSLYCELTNALFPDFAGENVLRTSVVKAMDMPKYEIASFTTPVGGQETLLSLAAWNPDTYIYIDWGNGELKEYTLQTTYTLFRDNYTVEGANVKVYSNVSPDGDMYVFSMDSVTVKDFDGSAMTRLFCLTLKDAGMETIDISKNTEIGELNLEGNKLTSIDLSNHKKLFSVILSHNQLTDFTLAEDNNIAWFMAGYNKLKSVNTEMLKNIYYLDLAANELESIDLAPMTGLRQLYLPQNQLTELNTLDIPLIDLDLSSNRFTFATLPVPNFLSYRYGNQAHIDIECVNDVIDLSAQAMVGETPTNFYFFDDEVIIYYDTEGNPYFDANEFTEGEDFFVENGIVKFKKAQPIVVGALMNPVFPSLVLYTNPTSVTANPTGISIVNTSEAESESTIYSIVGTRLQQKPQTGIYIQNGKKLIKK